MKLLRPGRLRYLEGEISNWHLAGGYVYLKIGGYAVCLEESRAAGKFKNRNSVRVLLREPLDADGVSDVLAWQRRGQERVHYQSMRVNVFLVLFAVTACVLGWVAHTAIAIPGAAVLVFEMVLAVRQWRVMRLFNSPERWASADNAIPIELPANVRVPLDLPLRPASAHVHAARASSWPAEILEFTHDAIIIWEMDGAGILYWNRAAEQLYGYSRAEAHGRITHKLLKTQLADGIGVGELETRLARYGVWVGQLRHTRSDGRRVEVEGRLSLMAQEHRPWLVLEVNRDVTDRNRAESERLEMEQQLKRLYSQTEE